MPGGILADDMGLGKTLSMIAMIVSSLPAAKEYANEVVCHSRECASETPDNDTAAYI